MENIFDKNEPGFYDPSNLTVKTTDKNSRKWFHTCQGYRSLSEALETWKTLENDLRKMF